MRPIHFIEARLGIGAQILGCEQAPAAIFNHLSKAGLIDSHTAHTVVSQPLMADEDVPALGSTERAQLIHAFNADLAKVTNLAIKAGQFPIILGGDHSIAIGTWRGINAALPDTPTMGLVWLDAHLDAHTFLTTPSYAMHGMPVADLLGHNLEEFVPNQQAVLAPGDLFYLGVRSYEREEKALIDILKVSVQSARQLQQGDAFDQAINRILDHYTRQQLPFGVSFDLDMLDPLEAPGVGTPEADGLHLQAVMPGIWRLIQHPLCQGLELVEYNPLLDQHKQTLACIERLCQGFLTSPAKVGL